MARDLLAAPCTWCEYNGEGYWQRETHAEFCPWYLIAGLEPRLHFLRSFGRTQSVLDGMLVDVDRFHREVLEFTPPDKPTLLSEDTERDLRTCLDEELAEYDEATAIDDKADALVDLVYFALGGLLKMGVAPGAVFAQVHEANMRKRRGTNDTRPKQHVDAVKPKGWTPPMIDALLRASPLDVLLATHMSPLFGVCAAVRKERGDQYNQAGVDLGDYFPFDHVSHAQMVHVKGTRLRAEVQGSNFNPEFSALREHLRDLVNYACFWYEFALEQEDDKATALRLPRFSTRQSLEGSE
jgi:hypothetical protein